MKTVICQICKKEVCKKGLGKHITMHKISSQAYYDKYIAVNDEFCIICGNNGCKFNGLFKNYTNTCSKKCTAIFGERTIKKNGSRTPEMYANRQEKIRRTCIDRYGVDNPVKNKKIKEKIKQTNLERYGNVCSLHGSNSEKIKNIFLFKKIKNIKRYFDIINLDIVGNIIKLKCNKCAYIDEKKIFTSNANSNLIRCYGCYPKWNNASIAESEVVDYLRSLGISNIVTNSRSIISPLELDIYLPDYNLAIEYNGIYWHQEHKGKDKNYHLNKTEQCEAQGIQLIHIFEDEWVYRQDIIKSIISALLSKSERICTARQTKIREITPKDKNEFLDENHRQGKDVSMIKLGAFYKDELVAVMTFSKPSIAKGSSKGIELNRFCTKKFGYIPGIAGKLFKHYTKNFDFYSIFSYADRRYSTGNLYKALGFTELNNTSPGYCYVVDNKRCHRFNYRKSELKNKLEIFDPLLTEYENMLVNGYDRIWDCGNKKYEYK